MRDQTNVLISTNVENCRSLSKRGEETRKEEAGKKRIKVESTTSFNTKVIPNSSLFTIFLPVLYIHIDAR